MTLNRRAVLAAAAASLPLAGLPLSRSRAAGSTLKIGVLTDMSGPYRDVGGPLAVKAVEQAVVDSGVAAKGITVEIISADHQNKPDIGAGIARQWYDRDGVDFLTGVPNSAVGLAVAGVTAEKNKVYANSGAATSDLTGKLCNANTIHWTYDTWMLAHSDGGAAVKAGGDSWFFITADYAFGHALQRDTTNFVTAAGGKVLGSVAYPFPGTSDFSSFLLQAQASGAKVIGLANAGTDAVNSIKQAHEFGITQRLAGLLVFISDIHALTLQTAQGLLVSTTFYWDLNDRTRAFSERMKPRAPDKRLTMDQAGGYGAALHYLKTAAGMGVAQAKADGAATVVRMKAMPTDDDAMGPGKIREDGRALHPCYLFQVKNSGGEQGAVGLLQAAGDHPGRPGVPAAGPGGLQAGEGVAAACAPAAHPGPFPKGEGAGPFALPSPGEGWGEGRRVAVTTIFGKPVLLLYGQLALGLINGAFYALLSLGLALIFGLLGVINFAHGALFMLGAFVAWGLLAHLGIGYWPALALAPLIVGALGIAMQRLLLRRLRGLDPLYSLLLTFGCALVLEGLATNQFGSEGVSYPIPAALQGATHLGFMILPTYRIWAVAAAAAVCLATWLVIERTRLGATLRAATENASLVQAFGVNVPRLVTLTFGAGAALAGFAGVLAAPISSVNPGMGSNVIIVVFAVVVIGGMGSIGGAILTGFALGLIEGMTRVYYPEASATVVFVVMAAVLLVRPAGLFGRTA